MHKYSRCGICGASYRFVGKGGCPMCDAGPHQSTTITKKEWAAEHTYLRVPDPIPKDHKGKPLVRNPVRYLEIKELELLYE